MISFSFYARASWCLFVGWLVRITFRLDLVELRKQLYKARIQADRAHVRAAKAEAERDAYEALANKMARTNAPTLPSMHVAPTTLLELAESKPVEEVVEIGKAHGWIVEDGSR